jgi:hypothetical protein
VTIPPQKKSSLQGQLFPAKEMFAIFRAGGQPESAAKVNAETFAREHIHVFK